MEENCILNFSRKAWNEGTVWENYTYMRIILKRLFGMRMWTGIIGLRIGCNDGLRMGSSGGLL
jgi:hypothetical protein